MFDYKWFLGVVYRMIVNIFCNRPLKDILFLINYFYFYGVFLLKNRCYAEYS